MKAISKSTLLLHFYLFFIKQNLREKLSVGDCLYLPEFRGGVVQREVLTSAIDSRMGEGVVLMRIEGRSPFQFGRKLPSFAGASVPS